MKREMSIPVGVVVAREKVVHPWQDHAWRAVEAIVPPPAEAGWAVLREEGATTLYLAGHATIELFSSEVPNYIDNLADGAPQLFVVLRSAENPERPLDVHLVTASPTEVQAYGHEADEIVGAVAMPPEVAEVVAAYCAEHDREAPFKKRRREPGARPEAHQFGQEPIVELRRRMSGYKDTKDQS